MRIRRHLASLILFALFPVVCNADTDIDGGVAWLLAHQNGNGSWGGIAELNARDTARVLLALQTVHSTSPAVDAGYAWLASQPLEANQLLSEQALALAAAKLNPSAALARLAAQHATNAPDFGGFLDHDGDTYDSAIALQALATNEPLYVTAISGILSTLAARQNVDGGWGIDQGFDSSPVLTSEVLLALSALRKLSPPPAMVAGAQTYLAQRVHADGSIGSDVLQTALALRALAVSGLVVTSFSTAALNYLRNSQAADGSWSGDPYLTSRVIEALAINKPNLTLNAGDFTLTPSTIADGASVTAKITVRNTGTVTNGGCNLSIASSDAPSQVIASSGIGSIAPGATSLLTITLTPVSLLGTHTLVATADSNAQNDEILESDNQTTATLIVTGKPDLQVFPADIATNPAHLQPNQPGQLAVTIHNNGEGDVSAVGYAVYDTNGSTPEILLQKGTTGPIAAALTQTVQIPITFGGGSHLVRVVADPDGLVSEVSETNNQATKSISVTNVSNVDLRVRPGSVIAAPSRPNAGDAVTVTAVIENRGTDPVRSTVTFYDGVPGAGGTPIASSPVAIDAQMATQVQAAFTTTAVSRVVWVVADPDNLVPEIDESNNSGYVTLTDQFADLSITRESIVLPKTLPAAGQTLNAKIVVRNSGLLAATNAEVVVYDDLPQRGGAKIVDTFVDVPALGSAVVPASWTVRAGQRFATAAVNPSQSFFEPDYTNNRASKLYVTSAGGGNDVSLYGSVGAPIDLSAMIVDSIALTVGGAVQLRVNAPNTPYLITIFEDVDGDRAFNPEVDNPLGSVLAHGGIEALSFPVQGTVRFAPPHLMVYLDSGNAIAEVHEDDNLVDVYHTCQHDNLRSSTPSSTFWTTANGSVTLSPVARLLDTNGDGVIDENDVPEVVIAYNGGIILKRGDTGQTLWSVQLSTSGRQISPVIADVDGDGKAEIIAHLDVDASSGARNQHRLVALNAADGSRKWVSPQLDRDPLWDFYIALGATYSYGGAPAVADLDGDGHPEVICGRSVLNGADGTIKWVGTGGSGRAWKEPDPADPSTNLYTQFFPDQEAPIAVDLNNDGILEVLAGNTAYRADGTISWQRSDLPDGYTAPLWLGTNLNPNVCLVGLGRIWMLNSDGSTLWGPVNIPNGAILGGAPTVFTNSGTVAVAVAGDGYLSAFNAANGALLWTRQVATDVTSFGGTTTNSATAFNHDGSVNLFYASRDQFVIIRSDGFYVRYTTPITNNPYYPMSPVVADVNNDGHAEVIVPGTNSVRVLGDPTWFGAPAVFNEAAYHAVNVTETGAIPSHEIQDSFSRVNYRANRNLASSTIVLDPNLTVSYPRADGSAYPANVMLTVRVGNNGWGAAPASTVGFYRLNADNTSTLLGTATSDPLAAGAYQDLSFTWSAPSAAFTFYAVADSPNTIRECDESDNRGPNLQVRLSADVAIDPLQLTVDDPNPRQGDPVNFHGAAIVSGAVDTTKLAAQFFLGDPASGGTPISPALPVTLTSDHGTITAAVTLTWTVNAPTGAQAVFLFFDPANLIAEDNETNNTASVALNVSTSTPIQKLSGTLTLTPPSAEAGTPVRVDLLVQNIGNVALSNVTLSYSSTSGASGSATLASLGKNKIASLTLGTFTPSANGTYTVTASAADPVTLIASPQSIVIGPFAGASLSAVPLRVPTTLPIVQVLARISRTNTINLADDPLVPLIRTHVQSGLDFEDNTLSAPSETQCFKCHVHAQGIISHEMARRMSGLSINDSVLLKDFNLILAGRGNDGRVYVPGYPVSEITREAAWAFSYWHDASQAAPNLPAMLNETVTDQRSDGSWVCDGPCSISLNSAQAWTLVGVDSLLRGYDQTKDPNYLASVTRAVRWMLAWNYSAVTPNNCEEAARVAIALVRATPYLDADLATQAKNQVAAIAVLLRSFQNADGSFGNTLTNSPILRTAQSLYALSMSGAPPSDPAVRAATIWLLNQQKANGQWGSPPLCCAPARAMDETTWAVIALTASWGSVGQFDVDLHLTLADSTDLVSSSPPPAGVSGRDFTWHLPAVTDSGSSTYLNLRLGGLQNQETRPIANTASISYADPNSGQLVSRPLTIPSITGIAPVSLAVTTDQSSYGANANVGVQETIDDGTDGLTNDVIIRDGSGSAIATLASNEALSGLPATAFPGWHYAVAATLIAPAGTSRNAALSIDFAQQLAQLGVSGTLDPKAIRVSADAAPSVELPFTWFPTAGAAGVLTLQIRDDVPAGATVPIHVFFDTLENAIKPSSLLDRNISGIGTGLLANYNTIDNAHSYWLAGDPSQLTTIQPPFLTNAIRLPQISSSPDLDFVRYWEGTFTGAFYAPVTGTYQFLLGSARGGWLYIDGALLLNDAGIHDVREVTGSTPLTAGFHRLEVIMYRWDYGTYGMYVKWAPPGSGFALIPSQNLFLDIPFSGTLGTPQLLSGGHTVRSYAWNTASTAAGSYLATATLHQNGAFVVSASAPFSIIASAQLAASVATDKAQYDAGDIVHATATVQYASGNTPLSNLTATTSILDPNGAPLSSQATAIATLAPGQNAPIAFDWPAGTSPAGTYSASVVVNDSAGATLAQKSVPFQIRPTSVSGKGISGTLSAPASVPLMDILNFAVSLTNGGNSAVSNAPFAVQIVDPVTQQLIDTAAFQASAAPGATTTLQVPYATTRLAQQSYQAWLVSLITGSAVPLANTTFEVTAPSMVVTASVTTDKSSYDPGDTLHATTTVNYVTGSAPLSALSVTTTIGTSTGTSGIDSIAPGTSASTTFDWPVGTTAPGTYTIATVVKDASGNLLAQASGSFTIASTAQTGKGISGTIATPSSVSKGEALPITVTITNNGNAALTDASFAVQIAGNSVPFTVTAGMEQTTTQQLSYDTSTLAPQTYTATLVSLITGQPVTLASSSFAVVVPEVVSFSANPATIVDGQSTTLSWTTSNATSVSISGVIDTQPPNGSIVVSPTITTTYVLTATGAGGTATASTTVTVNPAAASSIAANFNGTAIAAGDFLWFSSVFKVTGLGSSTTSIFMVGQTIQFTANGTAYLLAVPDSEVVFNDATVTEPVTSFDATSGRVKTRLPAGPLSGNTLLSGFPFPVPAGGLPGGIQDVTWSANFATNSATALDVHWQWAAAVYTSFNSDFNLLGIKPVDVSISQYPNSDHAGTPENFKSFVTGGATGGGGSNFTGGLSATAAVVPTPIP